MRGGKEPVTLTQLGQMTLEVAAALVQLDGEVGNHEACRNAVFVWGVAEVNAITECLFIAEKQVRNLADPFESGKCLPETQTVVLGHVS